MRSSSQPPASVVFSVYPRSAGWVVLESSTDLTGWQPVVNLLTTNSSVPFIDYPPATATVRLYRVRSPGVTAAQASSAWAASRPSHYQYRFENSNQDGNGVLLAGTVTVSNGVKTVTNVTANGLPTTTFDPADFLTPEEMIAEIADVEALGAKLAHVSYDKQWGFPSAVVIIGSTNLAWADYRMSEFADLSAGSG